jgi:arylsulfatase A-like enzyme
LSFTFYTLSPLCSNFASSLLRVSAPTYDSLVPRPNVLVFFTDQQRHDTTGLHGCPLGLTPNFDAWAQRGTHFAHAITPQPVCGPARACVQTGQFATAVGKEGCHRNGLPLPTEQDTWAKRFDAAGYATGYFGKWHLDRHNDTNQAVPEERRGGWRTWLASNLLEYSSDAYETRLYDENNDEQILPGYRVDAITDALIRWIDSRTKAGDSFCGMLSLLEPHMQNHRDDYPGPALQWPRFAGRWTPPDLLALPGQDPAVAHLTGGNAQAHWAGYCAMVERIDQAFGRVMDALISLGILKNTVVVFASDHACHFRTRNQEYKRSPHDASVRTPCLIHGGPFTGGGRREEPFQLTDLAPTLCDAAGLEPPEGCHGRSAVPLVRGGDTAWPREAFIQISESMTARAVRTPRWTYCVTDAATSPRDRHGSAYVETCFYDNLADPYQLINLAGLPAHESVRHDLQQRLLHRMAAAGEPAATIEDASAPDPATPQQGQRELRASDDLIPLV